MESVDLDSLIGKSLDNRFELKKLIGKGGYGAVFEAIQTSMQRRCAVKVLSFQTDDPKQIARFELEARVTCQLSHPNTIVVYEYGRDEKLGVFFIAMEFLDGKSLTDFANSRTLTLEETIYILGQIADSLDDAHTYDLVHRDIKPHNIMIVKRGIDELSVKVIDFGIAKTQEKGLDLTQTDTIIGTPEYMSTEQVLNKKLSGKSDQYALAVTAYFLLTGRTLFNCETALQIAVAHASEIPPALSTVTDRFVGAQDFDSILLKALAKNPDDRYDTCREFIDALADNKPKSNPDSSEYPTLAKKPALSTKSFEHAVAKTELAPSESIAKESEERRKIKEKEKEEKEEEEASNAEKEARDELEPNPAASSKKLYLALMVLAFLGAVFGLGVFQMQRSSGTPLSTSNEVALKTSSKEAMADEKESPAENAVVVVNTNAPSIGSGKNLLAFGSAKDAVRESKKIIEAVKKTRVKRKAVTTVKPAGLSDSMKETLATVKKDKKDKKTKKDKKKSAKGTVKIVTSPWGAIYIDGKKVTTRTRYTATLKPGKHVFVLKQNGVAKATRRLDVEEGDHLRVRLSAD